MSAALSPPDGPLSDILGPGMVVLFVGFNPGLRSGTIRHHYAGRGNQAEAKFSSGECAMLTSSTGAQANIRRNAKQDLEKLEKDGEVGKDDVTGAEKRLDGMTKKHTDEIDDMLKKKEAELLEV